MFDAILNLRRKASRREAPVLPPRPLAAPTAAVCARQDIWSPPALLSPGWGAHGGAYGRLARLHDGGLVGSLTTFQAGLQHLRITHVPHDGVARDARNPMRPRLAFEDIGTICEGAGDLDNVHLTQLRETAPGGSAPRLLAAFRNHDQRRGDAAQIYRITVCRSDNAGRDWRFHSEVACTRPPFGLWEPFLFNAPDDSLQVYYAREKADRSQDIVMHRSYDGGWHWQPGRAIAGGGLACRDGMPGVTSYFDGQRPAMFMVFESNDLGPFRVLGAKSVDGGTTWTHRAPVYQPPGGRHAGSPQVDCVGGHLVTVFMTDDDAPHSQWPKHAAIKAVVSERITPHSVTWSRPHTLTPAEAYWPGVLDGGEGRILLTYNHVVTAAQVEALLPPAPQGGRDAHAS